MRGHSYLDGKQDALICMSAHVTVKKSLNVEIITFI